jgi:hypothetical protein
VRKQSTRSQTSYRRLQAPIRRRRLCPALFYSGVPRNTEVHTALQIRYQGLLWAICRLKGTVGFTFSGVRGDHLGYTRPLRDPFFLGRRFCLGGILGLFVEEELVIGLSGFFRSPCLPLGISVESRDLEIVGLESGSGLKTGESSVRKGGLARSEENPERLNRVLFDRCSDTNH